VDDDSNPFSGYIARYNIKVKKSEADEPADFLDGNLAGILQRVGDKARFGLEFYNSSEGGDIVSRVDSGNMNDIITRIENKKADTWTPLAEAFYEGVRYFKQVAPYYSNGDYTRDNTWDPYYWNDLQDFVECGKSFVLLITDGESTEDKNIPSGLKDYDGDGNDPGTYGNNGSDYLDDVALWAHINDLRSDLDGDQTITFYPVFAFGQGSQLLKDAARNGGFIDKNGNNRPDLDEEWDANGDGIPDTYYEAESGYELEAKLLEAIADILERAAAGTAVSVLATSGEGEGNLVQAYFRPVVSSGLTEVKWVGYLQSLWVDSYGNLREDSNHDLALDVEDDKVITYFLDPATGDTKLKRFAVSANTPYPDVESDSYEVLELNDMTPLWEAGSLLAQMSADDRKIFTYIDKDQDGVVDESTNNPFDDSGEVVRFHSSSDSDIKPYLDVKDNSTWSYLGATHDGRVTNLIQYIRGNDISGLRTRTIDGNVWKLGDIVHSTPVSISKPSDNFHIIYSDESYETYYNEFKDRETVVYVGANDGMLHAFTSWEYNAADKAYTQPTGTTENIGDELWAYIPQSLLSHLKWLPSPDYTHVYYVDLKPKIFDAKILPDDTHYTDTDTEDNWGTILLIGLNMGGKHIQAEGDFDYDGGTSDTVGDFYPSYACIDVTDPRNPRLLWERTYTDLEMTTSTPAIVKVKDKWFAVFGSGPSDYDGTSNKKGHVFVVDLKTGDPYGSGGSDWLFETNESNAFMNSPISLDKGLNYNVDAIYFGESYYGGSWKGKLYKINVPWVDASGDYDGSDDSNYSDDPLDATNPWQLSTLFDTTRPLTSPVSLSVDTFDNVWVYVGSGRYFNTEDKGNDDTQYMFGIKDPFFNSEHTPDGLHEDHYYHNHSTSLELQISDLLDADPYIITEGGEVFKGSTSIGYWEDLLDLAQQKDGWIRTLTISKERILSKPSILGGIVFTTSYVPNEDICGFGGDSYLYGQYYETGTAYYEPVFGTGTATMEEVVSKIELGSGKASSLGIQVGMEEGAKGFIQQSTGTIVSETITPAFNIKSGLRSWKEK
jgi:type IV pilus assembly protein PilY1